MINFFNLEKNLFPIKSLIECLIVFYSLKNKIIKKQKKKNTKQQIFILMKEEIKRSRLIKKLKVAAGSLN